MLYRNLCNLNVILSTFLLTNGVFGQENQVASVFGTHLSKGEKSYYNYDYAQAIYHYKRSLLEDPEDIGIKLKIADAYRKLNDQVNAEKWYRDAVVSGQTPPEAKLHFAEALISNQKYDEAREWFSAYDEEIGNSERSSNRLQGLSSMDAFYQDSIFFEMEPIEINSTKADFSPAYYEDGIVYVSERGESPFIKSEYNWRESSFLDLFFSRRTHNGEFSAPKEFNTRVNTKYHEGPLVFYNDTTKVIFTRNNYFRGRAKRSKDNVNKLSLFFAGKNDDQWVDVKPFPYNSNEYSVGHPAITEDGGTLFFASDMPGGEGLTDIYVTFWRENIWTEPRNLGSLINTDGNEMFPFYIDGYLYIASDGHPGLGGLDVYRVALNQRYEPIKVENIGYPVNSSRDDFGFIIDQNNEGYFTSNRNVSHNDDIYLFRYKKPNQMLISGKVVEEGTGEVIRSARVFLMTAKNELISEDVADIEGLFEFSIDWGAKYILGSEKEQYELIKEEVISSEGAEPVREANLVMRKMDLKITVVAVDQETGDLIPSPQIRITEMDNGDIIETVSAVENGAKFSAEQEKTYNLQASGSGYFANSVNVVTGKKYGAMEIKVPLEKIILNKAIKLDHIYYDVNKADIRPDAERELDKLVVILENNPTIEIELSSHTDSRGSDKYNHDLSQRRAESAVKYIVNQGIDPSRITAMGYGEDLLVNDCRNGVNCTAEQHQENRRTEFKVTRLKE